MTDEADRHVAKETETAHDCRVVPELAVSMDFNEVRADMLDIVEEVGTLGMACKLYLLVRRQVFHRRVSRDEPCRARRFVQWTRRIRGPARSLRTDSAGPGP